MCQAELEKKSGPCPDCERKAAESFHRLFCVIDKATDAIKCATISTSHKRLAHH